MVAIYMHTVDTIVKSQRNADSIPQRFIAQGWSVIYDRAWNHVTSITGPLSRMYFARLVVVMSIAIDVWHLSIAIDVWHPSAF